MCRADYPKLLGQGDIASSKDFGPIEKKVFGLFLSLIMLMGLWSCKAEGPDNSHESIPEESSCLTFIASEESAIALLKEGEPFKIVLDYSIDGNHWNAYILGEFIYLPKGEKLMFRAGKDGNKRFSKDVNGYYNFNVSSTNYN